MLLQTKGDGNCLLNAVLGSCDFVEEEDGQKFGPHQLRLAIINHFIDYRELLFDEISEEIRLVHGALEDTDSGNGGYSYKSYLEYMMKNKVWCDTIMIKGIASMWSVKITVMYADTFYKVPYRHELASPLADIVLLFNGHYVNGHYCATLKVRGDNFVIGIPYAGEGYCRDDDRMERSGRGDYEWSEEGEVPMVSMPLESFNELLSKYDEGEITVIPRSEYDMLKKKADLYDEMRKMLDKGKDIEGVPETAPTHLSLGTGGTGTGSTGTGSTGTGSGGKKSGGDKGDGTESQDENGAKRNPADPTVRKRTLGKWEGEKEIPEADLEGTTICPRCHIDQKTRGRFDTHIKKFHKDIFNHLCRVCDHGFITSAGLQDHMLKHDKEAVKIKCSVKDCKSEFMTKDSYKNHMRKYHPVGGVKDLPCSFNKIGCTKTFKTKSNRIQHDAGCVFNPKCIELKCSLCGKGKFWQLNKLQEHKRDKHNWR